MPLDLFQIVGAASRRSEVRDAVAAAYADLQREIDIRRPVCVVSGRCCRFEEFGHRLFVTTMELARFLYEFESTQRPASLTAAIANWDGAGCPFQVAKLCGVHDFRPLGCRMFFCDATATDWQNQQYEVFHARLKRDHEHLEVPYVYLEWRTALATLGLDGKNQG